LDFFLCSFFQYVSNKIGEEKFFKKAFVILNLYEYVFSYQYMEMPSLYSNNHINRIIMILSAKTEIRVDASIPLLLLERYTSFYLSLSDRAGYIEKDQGLN
jgi:hypothetical protein